MNYCLKVKKKQFLAPSPPPLGLALVINQPRPSFRTWMHAHIWIVHFDQKFVTFVRSPLGLLTERWYTVGIWIPTIWLSRFLTFGFQISDFALCSRLTIQILDQNIRKQDGVHMSGIQMVLLSSIQMAFKYWTIWHPTSFWPFQYQTNFGIQIPTVLT